MSIYIFKVTTTKDQVWNGPAVDFQSAIEIACKVFLCSVRSIVKVELVKVVD